MLVSYDQNIIQDALQVLIWWFREGMSINHSRPGVVFRVEVGNPHSDLMLACLLEFCVVMQAWLWFQLEKVK